MSQAPQTPPPGRPPDEAGGSRNLWTGLAVGAGAIILAVVLFLVLRPDDSDNAANTTSETEPTTLKTTTEVTTEQTTTVETTTTTPADQPQRVTVRYENGEVVGGIVRADIEEGTEVVLVVHADVEDEVHLHGYDLTAEVAPGQRGRIAFTADEVGEFEVELENLRVPIAELTVE